MTVKTNAKALTIYISDLSTTLMILFPESLWFFLNLIFIISCIFLLHSSPTEEKKNLNSLFCSAFNIHYIFWQQTCSSNTVATWISKGCIQQAKSVKHLHLKRHEDSHLQNLCFVLFCFVCKYIPVTSVFFNYLQKLCSMHLYSFSHVIHGYKGPTYQV